MNKELKTSIIKWLECHENAWQRENKCIDEYRNYIYNDKGAFLIGGKEIVIFIEKADELLYGNIEV